MPIGGGDQQPEDIVDVMNIQSTLRDNNLPVNVPIDYAGMDVPPTYADVTDVIGNEWPTAKLDRYVIDFITEWPDPDFKQPWDKLDPQYQPYRDLFKDAYNPSAWAKAKTYADEEIKDDAIKRNMTPAQYAYYFGGSMLDPITMGLAFFTGGLGVIGKGLTVGQAALRTGALVAAESTVIEGVLQWTDPMRTMEESAVSIAAGWAGGTLIGAGGQKVYNLFHNAKGQRNGADNLNEVITTQTRQEMNLTRVDNALDNNLPLDKVDIPVRPPARMEIEGLPEETLALPFIEEASEEIFPKNIGGGVAGSQEATPIGEVGQTLYHESNVNDLNALLLGHQRGRQEGVFVTDDSTLAIGQGENKGIQVEFDSGYLSGVENVKPGTGIIGGREYKTNFIAKDSIRKITMPEEHAVAIQDTVFMGRFLNRMFDEEILDDGTRVYTKKAQQEPVVSALPPPEYYVNEMPTDYDEVVGALDDWVDNPTPYLPFGTDTRDPSNFMSPLGDEGVLWSPFKPIVHNKVMISPVTTLLYNVSPTFSRLGDMLGSNNIYKHGDYNQTRYNGKTLREEIKREERGAFMMMSDGAAKTQYELAKKGTKMTVDVISRQAGAAARRNSDQKDFLPEVYALGQQFRQQLDSWKERGIEQGVLTEQNIVELENYVPRFWDTDAISNRPATFRSTIKAWAITKNYGLDDEGLDQLVVDIKDSLNRINAGEDHPMEFYISNKTPKSGHALSRRIDAKDLDLEDFLVSDIRVLLDRYVRGVGADIIVREIFGKDNIKDINGLPMPKAQYDQGVKEFDVLLKSLENKVEAGSKLAKIQHRRLEKKRDAAIKAAENMLRGAMQRPEISRFPKLDSFGRGLQGYSAATGLGGVVQSAFPDSGNNVLQHGLLNMLASTPEFFKALPQVFSRNVAGGNRAEYWRYMRVALDNLMSNRMMDIAGIKDESTYGVKQGAFHGTEVARKAFRLFLADRWNTGAKLLAGTSAERAIFRDVQKMAKGTLGKNRAAKMHQMGVTQDVAERIAANLKEHGKTNGLINWKEWDDKTLQDLSRLLFRESEFQVVAPDGGEMPNGLNNLPGRLFMQYKTFQLSNTLKQTIPWSQKLFAKGDITVLAGLATLGALAIFSRYVKDVTKSFDKDSGFDIDEVNKAWGEKTAADFAAIAVTDGALLSFVPALVGVADNFFNNELGEAVGMTPKKRRWSPGLGIESNMAGLGYADTLRAATWGAAQAATGQKEYTARDLNKVRRSVILQNTFYLQWLFDWGEQTIVDEFNLPEKSGKKKKSRF